MKLVFVHFVIGVMPAYSHAIAALAAAVCEAGHDVDLLVVRSPNLEQSAERILAHDPEVVCMSVTSNQWLAASSLAHTLKTHAVKLPLWVGGSHVNAAPLSFLKTTFDAACYGEGEELLPHALFALSNGQPFKNPSWLTKECVAVHKPAVVYDLDSIPLPKLDIFDREDVVRYPSVMFSRGCPFDCTYCMSRAGGIGGRVRWKSIDRSIRETRELVACFQPDEIYFDDDTFLKNPKWVEQFLERYRVEIGLPFYCNARPELVNQRLCELLAHSGCTAVGIGIESGSERIRSEVLSRPISDREIRKAFDVAHSAGLKTWSFNMIGIPGETVNDLLETIKLNEVVKTDYVRVSVYTAYPGTALGDSVGAEATPGSYFGAFDKVAPEFRAAAENWLATLSTRGQLWNDE